MKLGFQLVPLLALNPRLASDISMSADGEKATAEPSGSVFAFHKPPGLTIEMGSAATGGAGGRKKTLNDYLAEMRPPRPDGPRLAPIGRLDKATEGLLLVTDDGMLNEAICRPAHLVKVYEATVKLKEPNRPTAEQLRRLLDGVMLSDGEARADLVEVVREWAQPVPARAAAHLGSSKGLQKARKRARREAAERGEEASADGAAAGSREEGGGDAPPMTLEEVAALRCYSVRIVVRLGRNRVVRRLLAAVDLPVYHLKRVSIGPLHLTDDLGLAEPGTFCALSRAHERLLRDAAFPPALEPAAIATEPTARSEDR